MSPSPSVPSTLTSGPPTPPTPPAPPSPPPTPSSPTPTEQTASKSHQSTPLSITTFHVPFSPSDGPYIGSDMAHDFVSHSTSTSPQSDTMGMDIDHHSPSSGVSDKSDGTSGAKACPPQVLCVYHQHMDSK